MGDPVAIPRILIIIPCHNEAGVIRSVLDEIASLKCGYDTLVIDDGSDDKTYDVARTASPSVRLVRNLGIGGAVQTGIKHADRSGYDYCVQIDGDGQHPAGEIARLLMAYAKSPTNIVIGSRYLHEDTFRSSFARRLGSRIIARTLHACLGGPRITDPTSGLRLLDRRAIAFFSKRYPHDFPEPISIAWALCAGLTISEVPAEMKARQHGASSIAGFKPLAYMVRVIGYIVLTALVSRPAGTLPRE